MGIVADGLSIILGSVLGWLFKERIRFKNLSVLSISIMIISLVGFFENIFDVNGMLLKSSDLLIVVFALVIGTLIGDAIQLDAKLSNVSSLAKNDVSFFIDAAIFFGVGGMQICGPILLAKTGDSSQLILKSIIDFPFALMFGISYGKSVALSALPVAAIQLIIGVLTKLSGNLLDTATIKQLCAMGYIILFFSGFNLICESRHKVNNVNMLIGIFIIFIYNAIIKLWGLI